MSKENLNEILDEKFMTATKFSLEIENLMKVAGAMMLNYLGEKEAAQSIESAIEKTLSNEKFRTKDLGGNSYTIECSEAIKSNL